MQEWFGLIVTGFAWCLLGGIVSGFLRGFYGIGRFTQLVVIPAFPIALMVVGSLWVSDKVSGWLADRDDEKQVKEAFAETEAAKEEGAA